VFRAGCAGRLLMNIKQSLGRQPVDEENGLRRACDFRMSTQPIGESAQKLAARALDTFSLILGLIQTRVRSEKPGRHDDLALWLRVSSISRLFHVGRVSRVLASADFDFLSAQ
jgi:hypothetical protein